MLKLKAGYEYQGKPGLVQWIDGAHFFAGVLFLTLGTAPQLPLSCLHGPFLSSLLALTGHRLCLSHSSSWAREAAPPSIVCTFPTTPGFPILHTNSSSFQDFISQDIEAQTI